MDCRDHQALLDYHGRRTVVFISDIHLSASTPANTQAFLDFLGQIANDDQVASLYILGDLFDVWIGDDHRSRYNRRIISSLAHVAESGTRISLIVGNRDFLLGENFSQQARLTLLPDEYVMTAPDDAQTRILLCHGDQLCTDDVDYQRFRQQSRQAAWQQQTLAKPLWQRKLYGRYLRWQSQRAQRNKTEQIMDANADAIATILQRHHVKWLIHGHTHRAAEHQHEDHTRWVLDAWHTAANSLWLTVDNDVIQWDMRWQPFHRD